MFSPIVMYAVCLNAAIRLNLENKNGETGELALTDMLIEREYIGHGYKMLPAGKTRKDVEAWELLYLAQREGDKVVFFKPRLDMSYPDSARSGISTAIQTVQKFQENNTECAIRGW